MKKIITFFFIFFILDVYNIYASPAFYFLGDTLYWCEINEKCDDDSNFLKFQLDKNNPPNINKENIKSIWIKGQELLVFTESNYWILHYSGGEYDWYIDGPYKN